MFCVYVCLLYVWFVCVLCVPSVLWYCWLGLLTCKNRRPYNLYCVGGDVKPCSINQSMNVICYVTLSGNIADRQFCVFWSMLPFHGLTVFLSRSCNVLYALWSNGRRYWYDFFAQIVLKFGLHQWILSSPNFAPKWFTYQSCWLNLGNIRWQIVAEWQFSHWRAYRQPRSLFRMVPLPTLYDVPFPQ